jgi:hypothetical protein
MTRSIAIASIRAEDWSISAVRRGMNCWYFVLSGTRRFRRATNSSMHLSAEVGTASALK